jgi:hypothetical protein
LIGNFRDSGHHDRFPALPVFLVSVSFRQFLGLRNLWKLICRVADDWPPCPSNTQSLCSSSSAEAVTSVFDLDLKKSPIRTATSLNLPHYCGYGLGFARVWVYVGVQVSNPYPNPSKTREFTPGFAVPVTIPNCQFQQGFSSTR